MPHTNEDTEKEIENEEAQTEDLQPNLQTGSITVQKDGHFIHCLTVIGQIEGHYILPSQNKTTKYEHVIPQLVAIEESDDVEGLLIILNTVGGDVEAGLAIAELLSTMQTPRPQVKPSARQILSIPPVPRNNWQKSHSDKNLSPAGNDPYRPASVHSGLPGPHAD